MVPNQWQMIWIRALLNSIRNYVEVRGVQDNVQPHLGLHVTRSCIPPLFMNSSWSAWMKALIYRVYSIKEDVQFRFIQFKSSKVDSSSKRSNLSLTAVIWSWISWSPWTNFEWIELEDYGGQFKLFVNYSWISWRVPEIEPGRIN